MRRHPLWPWLEVWLGLVVLWLLLGLWMAGYFTPAPSGEEGLAIPDLHRPPTLLEHLRTWLPW
jgi:hypothetical protein